MKIKFPGQIPARDTPGKTGNLPRNGTKCLETYFSKFTNEFYDTLINFQK